jgi:hypothetical protein
MESKIGSILDNTILGKLPISKIYLIMKSFLSLILAVLGLGTTQMSLSAQNNPYTFTIHLGAFMDAKITDFEEIRPYGYVYSSKLNNLSQIFMGDYTSESDATPILQKVKAKGYTDAFITRRRLDAGGLVTVIQLGTEPVGKRINWNKYAAAGPLHAYQKGDIIGIVTGPISNLASAQNRMEYLRSNTTHTDAFIKDINSVLLHKVGDFQTEGRVDIPVAYDALVFPDNPEEEVVIAEIPAKNSPIPNFMVKKQAKPSDVQREKPAREDVPESYENTERISVPVASETMTTKGVEKTKSVETQPAMVDTRIVPPPMKKAPLVSTYDIPFIRPKVKRTSALKLQEVLKAKGAYDSGLDGYYGAGTKKAYDKVMTEDQEMQKYKLLTELYQKESAEFSELEKIIIRMDNDISLAVGRLKGYRTPLADAFQAYGIYELAGPNKETDRLMNKAIKASFGTQKMKNKPPFDYTKTQTYKGYDQLIEHLRYIYGASNEEVVVPCWLFNKHPKETFNAFAPSNNLASEDYVIQDCGNITEWESIKLLETVMKEMTPNLTKIDQKNITQAQSTRAQILLNPKAQSIETYKAIDQWNNNLWAGLYQWESVDPLHSRIATSLRITYFQSWALLEDHFMNKGLNPKEARGLALEVLRTIVDPYLARYTKE